MGVRVGVATVNPLKIRAVKDAFESFFQGVEVYSCKPRSSLPRQPVDDQIRQGATARAKEAIELSYDYGVGIEGGLLHLGEKAYLTGHSVVISKEGETHGAWGLSWECPPALRERLERGEELGDLIDKLLERTEVKTREGAIGVLSRNKIDRLRVTTDSVVAALIPFVSREFYNPDILERSNSSTDPAAESRKT